MNEQRSLSDMTMMGGVGFRRMEQTDIQTDVSLMHYRQINEQAEEIMSLKKQLKEANYKIETITKFLGE